MIGYDSAMLGALDTDLDSVDTALATILRRARLPRFHAVLNARAGTDIEPSALAVLSRIDALAPVRLSDLAQHLGLETSTVCRHVQNLEAAGFLDRAGDPFDGRAKLMALNPVGRRTLGRLRRARRQLFAEVLETWSEADRHRFAGLLERFADGFGDRIDTLFES